MTDTPGTLEELRKRARGQIELGRATGNHTGNPINIYQIAEELLAAVEVDSVDKARAWDAATAIPRKTADEIASLRARVEVVEAELTEAVEHLEAVLFSDPGPKMLASIGSARAWWMKRDAREEAQALKDTPDE